MTRGKQRARKPEFSELLLAIQAMALDPARWPSAVQLIARYFDAPRGLLYSPSPDAGRLPGVALELDPDILQEYAEHWHQYDIWTRQAHLTGVATRIQAVVGEELVPHREFLRSTVYNECLRHNGVARLLTAPILPAKAPGEPVRMAGALYRASNKPAFSAKERDQYGQLLPHLALAMETHARIMQLSDAVSLWRWTAHQGSEAIIFLAEDGRVVHVSASAERLLAGTQQLAIVAGRLHAQGPSAQRRRFLQALAEASSGLSSRTMLEAEPLASSLEISFVPLPAWLSATGPAPRISMLVLIDERQPEPERLARHAQRRWLLTQAETRVLARLLRGRAPSAIATDLGLAISTVRTHLKRLYAKTNTRAQRELIAAVLGLKTHDGRI